MPKIYKKTCKKCGKYYEKPNKKFCSLGCIWKGRVHKSETKIKIGDAQKGEKNHMFGTKKSKEKKSLSEKMSGSNHPFFGKNRREETKGKISETRVRKGVARGDKNPNWKGGKTALNITIRMSKVYREWRIFVFRRDGFHCVFCGKRGSGDLEADHIKPYSVIIKEHGITSFDMALQCEELWDTGNGRTLCKECHRQTPTYGLPKVNK